MNIGLQLLIISSSFSGVLFGLYLLGRVIIPLLAEEEAFFTSPKLGRIKARRRSGRIINFYDNLVGKGKYVNRETGKIEDGELKQTSLSWRLFGAYFIGLDEIYRYKIATEAIMDNDGELRYTEQMASCIFLEGSYPITAIFTTKDGVGVKVRIQLKLTTLDAAKALSLPISWTIPVFTAVLEVSRDFFGARNVQALISLQNENADNISGPEQIENGGFTRSILDLNNPRAKSISLKEICGQYISAVNLVDIGFIDLKTKEAFFAPFVANQEAQKEIRNAEAYATAVRIKTEADMQAASNIATAITLKSDAEALAYGKKNVSLGGDSRATAQIIAAERHSTMENLTTLVNGGDHVVAIPINKKESEKKK